MGLRHAHLPEAQPLARFDLAHAPDVKRAYRADLRVATRGLPVGQQHDGLAVAYDLDAAQRHAVGDDVVATRVLDARPAEPRAHAVALLRHLIGRVEERRDATRAETVVLGTKHHAHCRLDRVVGDPLVVHFGGRAARGGTERQTVALAERAPLEAAQLPSEVGRAGAESGRGVETAGDRDIPAHTGTGSPH